MATFTVNLNGGDVETQDSELYYKLYGSANGYTTAFLTTGTATLDPNVSVNAGVATITNVTIGAETQFKIGVVDADGNESVLSDVYDLSPAVVDYYPTGNAASAGAGEANAITPWTITTGCVITSDSTEHYDGTWSIKFSSAADTNSRGNCIIYGLQIGTVYTVKVWVKKGIGNTQMARSWSGASIPITEFHTFTDWTEQVWDITPTATEVTMRFYPSNGGVANETLFIDKLTIVEKVI